MNLSPDRFKEAIMYVIAFILSVAVHEFGHALVADRLGDNTPRQQGRLTLSPAAHIDWMGTVLFPFIGGLAGGGLFAWGKPVWTRPTNYTRRFSMATGQMLVSIAGPLMNLLMAIGISGIVVVGLRTGLMSGDLAGGLLKYLVQLNLMLLFFNLLPMPPLDGGKVLAWVLPRSMQFVMDFLERWGFLILFALLLTGMIGPLMYPAHVASSWFLGIVIGAAGR